MNNAIEQILGNELYSQLSPLAIEACEKIKEYYTLAKRIHFRHDSELKIINEALMELYGVSLEEIMRKSRRREIVELRGMVWSIFRKMTGCGIGTMQRIFGWDHSTIYHNIIQCDNNSIYIDFEKRLNEFQTLIKNKQEGL